MQMVIFMMVIGRMIKLMVLDNIHIQMEPNMKDIGLMINNMDKEKSIGLMVHNMKETINLVKKMVEENSFGLIDLHMMVIS